MSKKRPTCCFLFVLLIGGTGGMGWAQSLAPIQKPVGVVSSTEITLPAQTKVQLVVIRPVWAAKARQGDSVFLQTTYPVTVGQELAVPAGSFVKGRIESLTLSTRRLSRAKLQLRFTQIILANGYVLPLSRAKTGSDAAGTSPADGVARMLLTIQTTTDNDLLLDNGTELELQTPAPLLLDEGSVAAALPLSSAVNRKSLRTATRCVSTPGTPDTPGSPGTPDIVIPGSPGTPDTVIPGGPGMPDMVIPGSPASPPTVIPGTPPTSDFPGTPAYTCPPPPLVISSLPVAPAGSPSVAPAKPNAVK